MAWVSLCEMTELQEGLAKYVEIDGYQLAVFLNEGKPFVIDNWCPHAGASMSAGHVREGYAICPMHGWAFKLESGELYDSPGCKIDVYPVRIYDGRLVQVELKSVDRRI